MGEWHFFWAPQKKRDETRREERREEKKSMVCVRVCVRVLTANLPTTLLQSSPRRRIETDVMKLLMSDYEVRLVNDNMSEFYVRFHGPKVLSAHMHVFAFIPYPILSRTRRLPLAFGRFTWSSPTR